MNCLTCLLFGRLSSLLSPLLCSPVSSLLSLLFSSSLSSSLPFSLTHIRAHSCRSFTGTQLLILSGAAFFLSILVATVLLLTQSKWRQPESFLVPNNAGASSDNATGNSTLSNMTLIERKSQVHIVFPSLPLPHVTEEKSREKNRITEKRRKRERNEGK